MNDGPTQINSGSVNQIRKSPLGSWLFVQMQNARTFHNRILARFLRKRGWVVFYLEPYARHCSAEKKCEADCWLELYNDTKDHL